VREFDPIGELPPARRVANRTIHNRLAAAERGEAFFDGDRANGYGGLRDDGRWAVVAERLIAAYELAPGARVLQMLCHKGYLLRELALRGMRVKGTETSRYAQLHAVLPIALERPTRVINGPGAYDLVICMSAVYMQSLPEAVRVLRECQRVAKRAFVTLGAWRTPEEYWILRRWMLLGCTLLTPEEWLAVMRHAGYEGDYRFDTVQSLGLT